MPRLEGRTAIVTGANLAGGGVNIGGASARLLAEAGANVVIAELPGRGGDALAESLVADGLSAIAVEVDLLHEDQVAGLVAEALRAFGGIDILHNSAGVVPTADQDVATMTTEVWDLVFGVDVRGAMLTTKHVLPSMLERGGGSIVNTSSVASLAGDVIHSAYGAAKAALEALTQYTATQYGRSGVRCNAICPGLTMSPAAHRDLPPPVVEAMLALTPAPRLAEVEDQARVVLFLASDDSALINGQTIVTDGGLVSVLPWVSSFVDQGAPAYGNA